MADIKFKYGSIDSYEKIETDKDTFYRIDNNGDIEVYLDKIPLGCIPVQHMPNPKEVFSENTPEEIQYAVSSGIASDLWSIGDAIPITLNGDVSTYTFENETYYAFIIGFDHNSILETNGKHSLTLQFGKTEDGIDIAFRDPNYDGGTSSKKTGFRMNDSNTNVGGWESCWMREEILPAFYNALPTSWQKVISAISKYTDNTGNVSETEEGIWATDEQIFLLAEYEIFGSRTKANEYEQNYQQQYDYYINNTKIKYKHFDTSSVSGYWSRSPYSTNNSYFCYINNSGTTNQASAYSSYGITPTFTIIG